LQTNGKLRGESLRRLKKSLKMSLSKATGILGHAWDHSMGYMYLSMEERMCHFSPQDNR